MLSIADFLRTDIDGPSFFALSEEEQAQHQIRLVPDLTFPGWTPRYQGSQLEDIPWRTDFEDKLGIVDYTRRFIRDQEVRGVVVPRHTVELFWVEKVARIFEHDEQKKQFLVQQVRATKISK